MRLAIGPVLLSTIIAAGCADSEDAAPANDPKAALMQMLEAAKATGATPYGEVLWYTRDNLYDYIDGMAEEYLGAGFVCLAHSEWQAAGAAGSAYVEIDVYDMGSAKGVAAVMTAPPPDKTAEVAPGVTAYRDEGICEFGAGRYYVRLAARPGPEGQTALLDALARTVAERASAAGP